MADTMMAVSCGEAAVSGLSLADAISVTRVHTGKPAKYMGVLTKEQKSYHLWFGYYKWKVWKMCSEIRKSLHIFFDVRACGAL